MHLLRGFFHEWNEQWIVRSQNDRFVSTCDNVMRFSLSIRSCDFSLRFYRLSRHSTKIGGYVDSSVTRLGYLWKVMQKLPKLWATFCAILKNVFSDKSGNFLTKFLTNPRQHFEAETQNIFLCNTFQLFVSVFVLI